MKRIFKIYVSIAIMALVTSCASGGDDLAGGGSSSPIGNVELNAALAKQGFSLDSNGNLIINDMVRNTTTLDLSSAGITHTTGLNLFSALESIDLSDNNFGTTINLKYLPASVTTLDLSGNETINNYENLASTYSKLTLPASAKWNMGDILSYVLANEGVDVEYMLADGVNTESYTTLREVPDTQLRTMLQSLYPSIFEGDMVDITKSMAASEQGVALVMENEIENLEGVEYVVCRAEYGATGGDNFETIIRGSDDAPYNWSTNGFSANIAKLTMRGVNTISDINLADVSKLKYLDIEDNATLERLTLPSGFVGSNIGSTNIFRSALRVVGCEALESIAGINKAGGLGRIELRNLANMSSLSMENLTMIHTIILDELPSAQITMPIHLGSYIDGWGGESKGSIVVVALSPAIAQQGDVQRFVNYQSRNSQLIDYTDYYIKNL